jgi:hypothetical protein
MGQRLENACGFGVRDLTIRTPMYVLSNIEDLCVTIVAIETQQSVTLYRLYC